MDEIDKTLSPSSTRVQDPHKYVGVYRGEEDGEL